MTPKAKKFGGIAFTVPAKQQLDRSIELYTKAFELMDSKSKESVSDQLERAWGVYVKHMEKVVGVMPPTGSPKSEEAAYVAKLAEYLADKMQLKLSAKKSA